MDSRCNQVHKNTELDTVEEEFALAEQQDDANELIFEV